MTEESYGGASPSREQREVLAQRIREAEARLINARHQLQVIGGIMLLIALGCMLGWFFLGVTDRLAGAILHAPSPDLLSRW